MARELVGLVMLKKQHVYHGWEWSLETFLMARALLGLVILKKQHVYHGWEWSKVSLGDLSQNHF